jgi:hypothetical protein
MIDAALFLLGLLGGLPSLVVGAPLSLVLPLLPAVAAGVVDGRRRARIRLVGSWLPVLAGAVVLPLAMIARDAVRSPPAPDAGLALSVGLALVGGYAVAIVAVTLIASALTRALSRRPA